MLDGCGNPFEVARLPNALGPQVQHLVGITGMVGCVANEHAVFATIGKFTLKLLCIICDADLTKNMERVEIWGSCLKNR